MTTAYYNIEQSFFSHLTVFWFLFIDYDVFIPIDFLIEYKIYNFTSVQFIDFSTKESNKYN